jgi:hypothetical protein
MAERVVGGSGVVNTRQVQRTRSRWPFERYDFGGMTRLAVRDGRDVKKRTKELRPV